MVQELIYPQTESQLRLIQDELFERARKSIEQNELPRIKHLMETIRSETNIITAIHEIKSNKGSKTSGSDGEIMQVDILQKDWEEIITRVQNSLDDYKPLPVRRKWIEKEGKQEKRPLGIPSIIDRIVQQCVKQVIEPILEAQFFHHSYGFRPMREAKHAIERISHMTQGTGYKWIVEGDISKFFDEVNHTILIKKMWNMGIRDRRVLMVLKKMLKAGIMNEIKENDIGTPQGGIISPLLANVYLHKLDKWIVREWEEKKTTRKQYSSRGNRLKSLQSYSKLKPAYFVRYADDWVLITNTKSNANTWKKRISKYLGTNLKLRLSEEKTLITNMKQKAINFLGFEMKLIHDEKARKKVISRIKPNKKKLELKVGKLHKEAFKLRYSTDKEWLVHDILRLNSGIRGIINYYETATWVNPILGKYNWNLNRSIYRALTVNRKVNVDWVPAKEVDNLKEIHKNYSGKISTIQYNGMKIGVTSLSFCKWKKALNKRQEESPYSVKGRRLYESRSNKKQSLARADDLLTETYTRYLAQNKENTTYNFEFHMNRGYALNRDRQKCKTCGITLNRDNLETHHIRKLSLDEMNKVNNLASLCRECHNLVHSAIELNLVDKKSKKIMVYREKFLNSL